MMSKTLCFAPDHFVPLSIFVKDAASAPIALPVNSGIAEYLRKHQGELRIACFMNGNVTYREAVWSSVLEDTVETKVQMGIQKAEEAIEDVEGIFTLVSPLLTNDFPVVTHWDNHLRTGRGGFRYGGTDGIGRIRMNESGEDVVTEHDELYNQDKSSPYVYNTEKYDLFGSAPGEEHLKAPEYESYIGDRYSLYAVDDLVAVSLSNRILRTFGYPVVLHNETTDGRALLNDAPVIQVVNGSLLQTDTGCYSLASYILPPYWNADLDGYPLLFNGYYDANENMFSTVGPSFIEIICTTLARTGKGVVGIIWNGGGSVGSRSLQESAYGGIAAAIDKARIKYGADAEKVVAVGGSRGGLTALRAAANPLRFPYRVRYAICYAPPLILNSPAQQYADGPCPLVWHAATTDTGYRDAWRKDWREPGTGRTGIEALMHTLTGESDPDVIRERISTESDFFLTALQESGTKVLLNHGTHDAFTLSRFSFSFAALTRSYDIPLRHEIGYRFGHNNCTNLYQQAEQCLEALLEERDLVFSGTVHYRRRGPAEADWEKAERFTPLRQPVFMEAPKFLIKDGTVFWTLYGEPGMEFRLELINLRNDAWEREQQALCQDAFTLAAGVLPNREYPLSICSWLDGHSQLPAGLDPGYYLYELHYRLAEEQDWTKVSPSRVPQPGAEPLAVVRILDEHPDPAGEEWRAQSAARCISWGLSEA
jgi:hypothetical protein